MNLPMQMSTIEQQILNLEPLLKELLDQPNEAKKEKVLDRFIAEQELFTLSPLLKTFLDKMKSGDALLIKSILAIGQGPLIFFGFDELKDPKESLREFLRPLRDLETFYRPIGGIVGYHVRVLKLILEKGTSTCGKSTKYLHPHGVDLSEETEEIDQYVRWGIEMLPTMADIYPVGGAGDRLSLVDDLNGYPLPAAQLQFRGRSLLEGLFRDLQAREYLYYKLLDKQLNTPVALMTSREKDNHAHITSICVAKGWFGRPQNTFFFFIQPLVPVITKEGNWSLKDLLTLNLKPGGHGVIWKLANDERVLEKLKNLDRKKVLIRQINNPVAATDYALFAFMGLGCKRDKTFGFASCSRLLKSAEGMDVLIQNKTDHGYDYVLTNIEYTDFEKKGIQDTPFEKYPQYSIFPSNTNILFADIEKIGKIAEKNPTPGMLINMKTPTRSLNVDGSYKEIEAGRLETTMQNIADYIVKHYDRLPSEEMLAEMDSFITFNHRRKTISVTKTIYQPGKGLVGTPEGCYYDILQNMRELLIKNCRMEIPELGSEQEYMERGPGFIFDCHPALGPLYAVISQKIQGGRLEKGAELQLEIAEVQLNNIQLEGSLLITAQNVVGTKNGEGVVIYGNDSGKCILKNVRIKNQGIDRKSSNIYWKQQIERSEQLKIDIQGNGEFYAENVEISGNHELKVPDGHRMIAVNGKKGLEFHLEKIESPTWHWHYQFDKENKIVLKVVPRLV